MCASQRLLLPARANQCLVQHGLSVQLSNWRLVSELMKWSSPDLSQPAIKPLQWPASILWQDTSSASLVPYEASTPSCALLLREEDSLLHHKGWSCVLHTLRQQSCPFRPAGSPGLQLQVLAAPVLRQKISYCCPEMLLIHQSIWVLAHLAVRLQVTPASPSQPSLDSNSSRSVLF